ncbi:MAG: hypothetical protein GWM98_28990, partial [Nitrospinaceae bacterium]|nr:hypothetical protein [Nitrospinaceae bacterium]NIR57970.1 hypothetical protein [Nitrospinaceae bacterium]NIT85097.1 hypothetical protein [Nitrospinaceae bacterium]NIW09017.1 hypothetical protein [Nitrospinaceae bacterium]NIX37622.1 hypothetical protein [Nitrospinaceae bacterium]
VHLKSRRVLAARVGALYFFKFFTPREGTVVQEKIAADLFHNGSHTRTLKTGANGLKKKRVKSELFDILNKGDCIQKRVFSFTYQVNDQDLRFVTLPGFLAQAGWIYLTL